MSDNSRQLASIKEKLVGQRIYEVVTNFNSAPYLSLKLGQRLEVVSKHEYMESVAEHRRCQPLRRFSITVKCPHALVSKNVVHWSTDDDYNLDSWAFYKGIPIFNMEVVPFLIGAYIAKVEYCESTTTFELDIGTSLIAHPVQVRPSNAIVDKFLRDTNSSNSDGVTLNELSIYDFAERSIVKIYNNNIQTSLDDPSFDLIDPKVRPV